MHSVSKDIERPSTEFEGAWLEQRAEPDNDTQLQNRGSCCCMRNNIYI